MKTGKEKTTWTTQKPGNTADKRFLDWSRIDDGNTGPGPNLFNRRKFQRPYIISLRFGVESFNP